MKRSLYVCLILALFITSPVAARTTARPDRAVRTRDAITTASPAPNNVWEAFVAMFLQAERRLTINDGPSDPPEDGDPTVNGVITEPLGVEDEPPPPNP